jgi:hypothetical protein
MCVTQHHPPACMYDGHVGSRTDFLGGITDEFTNYIDVMEVECPLCRAKPGMQCVTLILGNITNTHKERQRKAHRINIRRYAEWRKQ